MILDVNFSKRHFIAGPQFFLYPRRVYIDVAERYRCNLLLFNEVPGDPLSHTAGPAYDEYLHGPSLNLFLTFLKLEIIRLKLDDAQ